MKLLCGCFEKKKAPWSPLKKALQSGWHRAKLPHTHMQTLTYTQIHSETVSASLPVIFHGRKHTQTEVKARAVKVDVYMLTSEAEELIRDCHLLRLQLCQTSKSLPFAIC